MDWERIEALAAEEQAEFRARKAERFWQVAGDVALFTASAFFLVLMVYAALVLA